MKLRPVPIKLREANDFVEQYHRHNKRTQGGRFAIGATTGEQMIGVAISFFCRWNALIFFCF